MQTDRLVVANARRRAEQTEEAFTLSVLLPNQPAVVRRGELTCPAWFLEGLRREEAARAALLRAVGKAVQGSPPASAGVGQ